MKMKIKMLGVALLSAVVLGWAGPVSAAGKINAVVVYVSGQVQVKRAGEQALNDLSVNDLLYYGDSVKTGAASRVGLVTKGGAEVRLNENSIFEIAPGSRVRELVKLSVGQLWTRMLHKRVKISVRTPSAVCAVRGTEADIEQRSLLTVKVYEGHVDVQNSLGTQSLAAGQMTTVAGANAAPEAAKKMGSSDSGNWQEGASVSDYDKFINLLKESGDSGKKLKTSIKMPDGTVKEIEGSLKKK